MLLVFVSLCSIDAKDGSSIESKVKDLLGKMTLEEKIG